MPATKLASSVSGLVSSNRSLQTPLNSRASSKSAVIAFAWPMCKYPFGSGGNLVWTRPPKAPVALCSTTTSWTKFAAVGRFDVSAILTSMPSSNATNRNASSTSRTSPGSGDTHMLGDGSELRQRSRDRHSAHRSIGGAVHRLRTPQGQSCQRHQDRFGPQPQQTNRFHAQHSQAAARCSH